MMLSNVELRMINSHDVIDNLKIKVHEMDEVIRTPDLHTAIRKLTIAPYSGMNTALNAYIREAETRSIEAKAIVAWFGNEAIAWALHSTDKDTDHFNYYDFESFDKGICFQVYVSRKYRRMGIGGRLLTKSTELAGSSIVRVYHSDAPEFFNRHIDSGKNVKSIKESISK